ncbi:hypothetical protein DSO57_1033035 [Entomophthora muscae]|uniref:Uncharacterized protein n=1 Tax=Entomophthora muscae TaxID=34485 RepID=A0ACC2U977_9FUNG|nr:hypothetical protein DSO57_1033035 [Entomophthora muscae]
MSASAPPVSAVESPARAPAASALAFLVAQQLPSFKENGYTAWLYTFEDYTEHFKLSNEDCLHEVSCFLLGEARVWHQDVQVATWANWKAQAELCFTKHEPDAIHQLGLLKMVHFKSLRNFLNTYQKTANKALKQHLKTNSSSDLKTTVENFHSLVSIRAFVNTLTHSYSAMVQAAKPNLLEEAIALVCDKYDIWVEQATDEHTKENSEWNPFAPVRKQNKSEEIAQEVKAHLEDLNRCFDAMFMAQEQGCQPNPPTPCTFQRDRNRPYNPCCYNCSEVGHISKGYTAPCSICKEPSHSNFICEFNPINHDRKPQGLMMAEQNYEAKHALSSSATPQSLNKKSTLGYIVDPDRPSFPFTLIRCKLTPPPMKCTDCKDAPSPYAFSPLPMVKLGKIWTIPAAQTHPANPHPPPCHPACILEIEDDLENEDHYPCLPDLDKYLPFEDNPYYNILTVESVPESPHNKGGYSNSPSETPSLEASPADVAAWGHRTTGQESKDKGPTAFGCHHCIHPGPLVPAMVSWVNSPGFEPIRSLNTGDGVGHGLSADPADFGEPIRLDGSNKFNAQSALYDVNIEIQPIILQAHLDAKGPAASSNPRNLNQPIRSHAPQDAMAQRALYNPRDLAQPINSSGATCNSMHMASSEFSNLDKPITPDDAMKVDSANILINDCNLTGPITPNNVMEVDSPNALINKCNLNEPIKPLKAMETDTPNVLSNNCNSDGPMRPCAASAKVAHPDQAGCPTPGHPIRSRNAMKTNTPNLLHHYYNSAGPIRSGAANTNYIHTDQAGHPVPNHPIKPRNTKTSMHPIYCAMIIIQTSQSDLAQLVKIIPILFQVN